MSQCIGPVHLGWFSSVQTLGVSKNFLMEETPFTALSEFEKCKPYVPSGPSKAFGIESKGWELKDTHPATLKIHSE